MVCPSHAMSKLEQTQKLDVSLFTTTGKANHIYPTEVHRVHGLTNQVHVEWLVKIAGRQLVELAIGATPLAGHLVGDRETKPKAVAEVPTVHRAINMPSGTCPEITQSP